ncbi:MAG: DUF368 domain-containing protein [Patescibacteria group bacterium]
MIDKLLNKLGIETQAEKRRKDAIRLFFSGFSMGAADIVPGVSGGTVAFILGIYEELIYSIKVATSDAAKLLLKGKVTEALKSIPFQFLLPLGLGILSAVFTLAKLLDFLLTHHPVQIWSFFFGLVLISIFVVAKRIKKWEYTNFAALILGAVAAYLIVGLVPTQTPYTPLAVFLSGMVAIMAMILPGISGSFLLLIMGKYQQILGAVNNKEVGMLLVFVAGAIVGLAVFSQVLNWLYTKHHDLLVATLIGFMSGSLRKVWPWKETLQTVLDSHGKEVPIVQINTLPTVFNAEVLVSLMLFMAAIIIILYIEKLNLTKEQTGVIKEVDKRSHS